MIFGGMQKLSMVDFPGHMCATIFTVGCNMRCPFCHNAPLVLNTAKDSCLSEDDVFGYLEKRRNMLDAVCITGGEPLLNRDILPVLDRIRGMGFALKLDSNGTRPALLKSIIENRMCDYIAMDIKNCRDKYSAASGCEVDLAAIEESISLIRNSGIDYEFRTTVCRPLHTDEDIENIGKWLSGSKRYALQQYSDDGEHIVSVGFSAYPKENLLSCADKLKQYFNDVIIRGI